MAVAQGYRDRHLPADVLVVDWFYYTKMGQMDMDPKYWPDPKAMNEKLHQMGFETMISVWPRFTPDDRYYDFIKNNGWFEHLADGTPENGLPYDRAGSDIDTTNPDAAKWYWNMIHDNILSLGFDSLWADETEPDLPPNGEFLSVGPGTEFFDVYPYFHTKALYDGYRKDEPNKRALILSRDAYIGAQSNGAIFWSSDIYPTWDTLQASDSHRARFCGLGSHILVQRHRRLAVVCRACIIPRIRRCLTPPTRALKWAATTIIPSSTRAGSSTPPSCPSCGRTARARKMKSGATASRPSRSWKSTCACATS